MRGTIICLGNRFVPEDAAGCLVYDRLQAMQPLPAEVAVIEGGLAGLDLLIHLERGGRVVFVDAVSGFTRPGGMVVLDRQQIIDSLGSATYGHEAGLSYLLAVLPRVCEGELPEEIFLLGLEGICPPEGLDRAAGLSLAMAVHGVEKRR